MSGAAKARGVVLGGRREGSANLRPYAAQANAASAALRAAKARARAEDLAHVIEELRATGAVSLRELADGLNARGIPAARGGKWSAAQVARVVARAEGAWQQGAGRRSLSGDDHIRPAGVRVLG